MLVLPTQKIPGSLIQFINQDIPPARKFLNGYRNVLTKSLKLVLSNNINYCGQAFSYTLKDGQQILQKIKTYENQQQILEAVQNNYVLVVKKEIEMFDWKKQKITVEQIGNLLQVLDGGQNQGVAKNLLLNIFDSYQQLQLSGLQPILIPKQAQTNPTIIQQQNIKYCGQNILLVPQVNTKTGTWSYENTLKLLNLNKTEQKQQKIQMK